MYKNILIILVLSFMFSHSLSAQKTDKKSFFDLKSRAYYVGGNLGLMFGNVTIVDISPEISIGLNDRLQLGTAFLYTYYSERSIYGDYHYSIMGGRIFSRYFIHDQFYLHAEYEKTFYKDPFNQSPTGAKYITTDGLNAGLGYIMGDRQRSYQYIALLYNVLDNEMIFGINPFFRFGFIFALNTK